MTMELFSLVLGYFFSSILEIDNGHEKTHGDQPYTKTPKKVDTDAATKVI